MAKFDLQVASKQKKSLALDPVVVLVFLIQSIPDVYEGIEPFMLESGVIGNKGADRVIMVWTLMKIISDLVDVGDANVIELKKLSFDRLKTLLSHVLRDTDNYSLLSPIMIRSTITPPSVTLMQDLTLPKREQQSPLPYRQSSNQTPCHYGHPIRCSEAHETTKSLNDQKTTS